MPDSKSRVVYEVIPELVDMLEKRHRQWAAAVFTFILRPRKPLHKDDDALLQALREDMVKTAETFEIIRCAKHEAPPPKHTHNDLLMAMQRMLGYQGAISERFLDFVNHVPDRVDAMEEPPGV